MRLTKHHGLGNDFLVAFQGSADPDERQWASVAARLCERRRGVGADGLVVAVDGGPDEADLTMALFNADGSRAEISGNGIRCLAHAETRRREMTSATLRIATDAGLRTCDVTRGRDPSSAEVSVTMGKATPGPEPDGAVSTDPLGTLPHDSQTLGLDGARRVTVDVGNPHLVVEVPDASAVDAAQAGPLHQAAYPGGINVHFMSTAGSQRDALTIATWERGAGATEACGSGACAAAVVAHRWDLVGSPVTVHMTGGTASVTIDGDELTLTGPATYIAAVEVEL